VDYTKWADKTSHIFKFFCGTVVTVSYISKVIYAVNDQNESGFFEGPVFIQPIRAI